jgi:hypothetical protein
MPSSAKPLVEQKQRNWEPLPVRTAFSARICQQIITDETVENVNDFKASLIADQGDFGSHPAALRDFSRVCLAW